MNFLEKLSGNLLSVSWEGQLAKKISLESRSRLGSRSKSMKKKCRCKKQTNKKSQNLYF